MNKEEFLTAYRTLVKRAFNFSEIGRCEGLLALESLVDKDKVDKRDILNMVFSL